MRPETWVKIASGLQVPDDGQPHFVAVSVDRDAGVRVHVDGMTSDVPLANVGKPGLGADLLQGVRVVVPLGRLGQDHQATLTDGRRSSPFGGLERDGGHPPQREQHQEGARHQRQVDPAGIGARIPHELNPS